VSTGKSLPTGSPVCCSASPATFDANVDELFDTYITVLVELADELVPPHVIHRHPGRPDSMA